MFESKSNNPGEIIRGQRVALPLTQQELAERLGIRGKPADERVSG